jgi:hypothetical protein
VFSLAETDEHKVMELMRGRGRERKEEGRTGD